jgi:hypothetical protein
MSFNKRYYNIGSICDSYKEGGINGVIKSFNKIDAFFFEDNISSKIHQFIIGGSNDKAIKLIEKQISNI